MRSVRAICLLTLTLLAVAGVAQSQTGSATNATGKAVTLGILPFADATASGNRAAGADVARTLLSAIVNSTSLQPRLLAADGSTRDAEMDPEKAIALGRTLHLDQIFVGTVLDARSEESSKGGWIPSFKGQSGNVTLHRVKATVTLQGELYDVASGRRFFSSRVTGTESNNAIGGKAYTSYGAWGNDSYRNFLDSPMGKALQAAIADMTKKIDSAHP